MSIAVVIPTNRPESYRNFLSRWEEQFRKHNITVIQVLDGDKPQIILDGDKQECEVPDLIPTSCAGVRNLGFYYIAKYLPDIEYIITLDDDVSPDGDTIGDHIRTLNSYLPSSWFSTSIGAYMRGFPYGIREETEVVLSHGIWQKNPDWDAPTQLLNNNAPHTNYYQGLIPKGMLAPICGMNVAFKRKAIPYVYYAPVGNLKGAERFDDIWGFIATKRDFDKLGWGLATGYASCIHERESNVYKNLEKEAVGIGLNEQYWKGEADHPWFEEFHKKREEWQHITS